MMRSWHDFLDSIDSDGGTRLILMALIAIGLVGQHYKVPKAEEITVGAFGALLMTMKDSGSNKDRREGDPVPLPTTAGAPPVVVVEAAATPAPLVAAVKDVAGAIKKTKQK